jgi:hypothetical protein
VDERKRDSQVFTAVYVNSNEVLKKECFEEIKQMASGIFMPWLLLGDYNEILSI